MPYNHVDRKFREFDLKVGLPDNEYGRSVFIMARSSLEAGSIAINAGAIPDNFVAHWLIDPVDARPVILDKGVGPPDSRPRL